MKNIELGSRVWFITGTSQGFGKELVRLLLERGDYVIATSRTPEKLLVDFPDAKDHLLVLQLDIRDSDQVRAAVEQGIKHYGHIDVLVNNAGYGLFGAIEEVSDKEIADIFEINVFGLLRVTRAVLPHMRARQKGFIVNISSIAGLVGTVGAGIYCATKFAVTGLSESLELEVAPLGIRVMVVEPGPFRTEFLGNSLVVTKNVLPGYESTAGKSREYAVSNDKKQKGDPYVGAKIMIEAVYSEKPPLHLLLGSLAYERMNRKFDTLHQDMDTWKEKSLLSDLPDEI